MKPSSPSLFQAPLAVDITWHVDASSRAPPSAEPYLLPLYDLLRRKVRPEGSNESPYDFALRPGVGIPTLVGRPLDAIGEEVRAIASSSAMRVAVVLLEQTVARGGEAFRRSFDRLVDLAASDRSRFLLLPVLVEAVWQGRSWPIPPIDVTSEERSDRTRATRESVAIRLSQWLMGRNYEQAAAADRRVRLFVSHSKHRRGKADITAESLKRMLQKERRMGDFFEVTAIETHSDVAERLRNAQKNAIVLCVRTDSYAESPLCQSELLLAKELQIPTVMVTQLADGERRAPAYGGNMVNVVFQPRKKRALLDDLVRVWLHNLHFPLHASAIAELVGLPVAPVVVVRHPELVDFALGTLPADVSSVVLYPDPPLPTVETQVLRQGYPRVRLTTPTTLFGNVLRNDDPAPPLVGLEVALSLSESSSADDQAQPRNRDGYTSLHVDDVIAHLILCLVRAGATLAYGGRPQDGYTNFLAALIDAHNQLSAKDAKPLKNYLSAHSLTGGASESTIYTDICTVGEDIEGYTEVCDALRYVRMRQRMADACDARIALGGKMSPAGEDVEKSLGYVGRFPGIVEECWRTLEAKKPLYVIGGFGGAAGAVVEALLRMPSAVFDEATIRARQPSFDHLCRAYDADPRRLESDPKTLDELAERIGSFGEMLRSGLTDQSVANMPWTNGLNVAENLRLFKSRDLSEIVHLVMKGLHAYRADRREGEDKGNLRVRLYHGNLADAPGVGAYLVGVVNGIRPRGDEAVLDERLGGAIREPIERSAVRDFKILPSGGARLAGDWVVLIDVEKGPSEAGRLPIEGRIVDVASKHGLRNVALSPSALGRERSPAEAARAILDALRASPHAGSMVVTLCEAHDDRFEQVKSYVQTRAGELDLAVLPPDPVVSMRTAVESPLTLQVIWRADALQITVFPPSDDGGPIVPVHTCARDQALETLLNDARVGSSRNPPNFANLERTGCELAEKLFGRALMDVLSRFSHRPWDIVHDPDAGGIPWELLHIPPRNSAPTLGERALPPALLGGLRRRLRVPLDLIDTKIGSRSVGPVRNILLIVNPLADLLGTDAEAEALVSELEKRMPDISPRVLRGNEATVEAVQAALSEKLWDVLHYAGHACFRKDLRGSSGLKLYDGTFTAQHLGSLAGLVPPLVFLNACESARVRGEEAPPSEDDVGPPDIGLAESFLRGGVRTLIGNFWRVKDSSARELSKVVYEELSKGSPIGKAVLRGRKHLFEAKDPSWANYLLYGDAELHW